MFLSIGMSAKSLMRNCAPRAIAAGQKWMGSFSANSAGNMGMMFAMMIIPTTAAVGMAIDYGRAYSNKHTVQEIVDSAVLQAASYHAAKSGANPTQVARDYFTRMLPDNINAQLESVSRDESGNVTMAARIKIETYFLKLIGRPELEANVEAVAEAVEGGAKEVEMAVVFDVTGSMGSGVGSKMEVAKAAALDLVDIMIPEDDDSGLTRISLVPFSEMVNLGPDLIQKATGEPAQRTVVENNGWTRQCRQWRNNRWRYRNENYDSQDDWEPEDDPRGYECTWVERTTSTTYYLKNCTVERLEADAGDAAYDDTPPTTSATRFHAYWTTNAANVNSCVPSKSMMPLTSDRDALAEKIATFSSSGGTAGHLGTAWGWYTLSPRWAEHDIFPVASQPKERDDEKRMKALVIMTDGVYNHQYNNSYNYSSEGANGSSQSQAAEICENAKAEGIEVFAIGVQITSGARAFLQECVSDPNHLIAVHYYDANTAAQVRPAFQAIAEAVSIASGGSGYSLRLKE